MISQDFNFQELIPEYWDNIYVPSWKKLVFLGTPNLEYLKFYWENRRENVGDSIKELQAKIDLLEGRSVHDFREMADRYEHPLFPLIGIKNDEYAGGFEPFDKESFKREAGSTTFNYCGWCAYCECGVRRHGYFVNTVCTLTPDWLINKKGLLKFDTPCLIANGTQEFLDACVDHLKAKLLKLKAEGIRIGSYIDYLTDAMKESEKKPCFGEFRPADWFDIGDKVMCFVSRDVEGGIIRDAFIRGEVFGGHRHGNGIVSVCLEEKAHTGELYDGFGIKYGLSRPEVMHDWEYGYLRTHPDYLDIWIRASVDTLEYTSGTLIRALGK